MPTEKKKMSFDDYAFQEDGHYYWWASWFANTLGYKSLRTFMPSIDKAQKVCVQLEINPSINFIPAKNDGKKDMQLSKFGCFLVALEADARKKVVKKARAYFLNELQDLNLILKGQDYLNRMIGREEIRRLNKDIVKAARKAHVEDFQFFMNEGYLGMYNKTVQEIKRDRMIHSGDDLTDHMSMLELSANLFRITLTSQRLKLLRNPTQAISAKEHWKIGSQIRSLIKSNTGLYPENLPVSTNLNELQKKLEEAHDILNQEINHLVNKNSV